MRRGRRTRGRYDTEAAKAISSEYSAGKQAARTCYTCAIIVIDLATNWVLGESRQNLKDRVQAGGMMCIHVKKHVERHAQACSRSEKE
jgi:hypothetical protein